MSYIFNGVEIKKRTFNSDKMKKAYLNDERYWSAGSTVTYYVDSATVITEEVDNEVSCLSPKTFTPSKSGWTFVGWREDTTADSSVLSSKIMDSDPITLYAVFKQTVTATFYSGESKSDVQTVEAIRYYNNGNVENASVTVPTGASVSGWTWRGWGNNWVTDANAEVFYANGGQIVGLSEDREYYGLYQKTVTLTYYEKEKVYGTKADTRYYNAAGNYKNPTFSFTLGSLDGWTVRGWGTSTAANASVVYNSSTSGLELANDITIYGLYQKTVTGTFISGLSKANSQTADGNRYYNSYGNTQNATITAPSGASVSGWTWRGWASSGNTSAAASVTYANSASITGVTANFTVYGLYQQTITLSYNGNGSTGGSVGNQTGTRYHNSAGNDSNPSFTLANNGFARSGYNFNGWNLGAVGASITLSANATAYAQWSMVSILVYGVWQSSATSVNNGVMSYNSEGYLEATISVKDGTATFAGPSFNIDVTDLSTISFIVHLWGWDSTDASGSCTVTFTIGGKSINVHHYANAAATTQTLSIDVSSMSGVQKCTCTMVEDCRQEDDEWGWSSNHIVRLLNIKPT